MQKVLDGLNPDEGPDFVEVYIDDVFVFSRTMEEHVKHLHQVLERLRQDWSSSPLSVTLSDEQLSTWVMWLHRMDSSQIQNRYPLSTIIQLLNQYHKYVSSLEWLPIIVDLLIILLR